MPEQEKSMEQQMQCLPVSCEECKCSPTHCKFNTLQVGGKAVKILMLAGADAHPGTCAHTQSHGKILPGPTSPAMPSEVTKTCTNPLCLKCAHLALIEPQGAGPLQGKDKTKLLR